MGVKIKNGLGGLLGPLHFKTAGRLRERIINNTSKKELSTYFPINEKEDIIHPHSLKAFVKEIIHNKDSESKTFILCREENKPFPLYHAGQSISLIFMLNDHLVSRPYSISSSPYTRKEGTISITVNNTFSGGISEHIIKNWKVGQKVFLAGPFGTFFYQPYRDSKNIIALASGTGVLPFLSMANAIKDGIEDFNLTIIIECTTIKSVIHQSYFDLLSSLCDKIKVFYVTKNNAEESVSSGKITPEIIKEHIDKLSSYSLFICGDDIFVNRLKGESLFSLVNKSRIRTSIHEKHIDVSKIPLFDKTNKGKVFNIEVHQGDLIYNIKASSEKTLLLSFEKAEIVAPNRCQGGECGLCRSRVISGTYFTPIYEEYRRKTEIIHNYIHPCVTYPTSDMVIEIPCANFDLV